MRELERERAGGSQSASVDEAGERRERMNYYAAMSTFGGQLPPDTPLATDAAPLRKLDTIEETVAQLGELGRDAVVVGDQALVAGLGEEVTGPRGSVAICVPAESFGALREQGWTEDPAIDGGTVLRNGDFTVFSSWGFRSCYEDLKARSWLTDDSVTEDGFTVQGVPIAGFPDLFAKLQEDDSTQSRQDWMMVRERFLDSAAGLPPDRVMKAELAAVRATLPEAVRDHPEAELAVRMTAFALLAQETLHGHPDIGRTNQMVGELEVDEYKTVAAYHNAFGLLDDLVSINKHCDEIGATPEQRLDMMVADSMSDVDFGNGREAHNESGFDELRAAKRVFEHAVQLRHPRPVELWDAVIGTTFDERTKSQAGKNDPNPVVQGVAGADLQTLSERGGIADRFRLIIEDKTAERPTKGQAVQRPTGRILGRVANNLGLRIRTVEEGLEIIDKYGSLIPAELFAEGPGSSDAVPDTLRDEALAMLAGGAEFVDPDTGRGHVYPASWSQEDVEARRAQAAKIRELVALIQPADPRQKPMTFVEAYRIALQEGQGG